MNTDLLLKIIIPLCSAGIGAIIGATLAYRNQYRIELKRDKRAVIQNLMMYRNVGAHELDWIKALNVIDIVFHENKKVRELYHSLLAQLRPPLFQNNQWVETFYQLVYEMAQCSDYKNLTIHDIRDYYAPGVLDTHYPSMNVSSEPLAPASNELPKGAAEN